MNTALPSLDPGILAIVNGCASNGSLETVGIITYLEVKMGSDENGTTYFL
jgi:hypothetical protein